MRARSGILSPRRGPEILDDLAERAPLIARQRVRRRRDAGRTFPLPRWLILVAALALLAGSLLALFHWLLTSPRVAVAQLEMRGLSRHGEEEVRAAAGIEAGENLFRLDPEAVAHRLERLPWVKRAQVIRSLPNQVILLIEERQPFTLAVGAGRLYWLDEEGAVLGPEPRAVAPALPLIAGIMGEDQADGRAVSVERTRMGVALLRTILRTGSQLATRLSEIDVGRTDEGPVLYTVDGIELRLGSEWGEERLGRLEAVLAQLQAQQEPVASIDFRFRDQVVLKLKR